MVDSLFVNIQLLSYLSCFGAFLFLAVLVGLSRTGGAHKYLLLACCVATVIWSGVVVAVPWVGPFPKILAAAEILRNLLWLTMLGTLLGIRRFEESGLIARLAVLTVAGVSLILLYAGSFADNFPPPPSILARLPIIVGGGHVLLTGIVQSSSAVTVATIGFVNAGILTLGQAMWVIFGSNVGTTMTGWIVCQRRSKSASLAGVKMHHSDHAGRNV